MRMNGPERRRMPKQQRKKPAMAEEVTVGVAGDWVVLGVAMGRGRAAGGGGVCGGKGRAGGGGGEGEVSAAGGAGDGSAERVGRRGEAVAALGAEDWDHCPVTPARETSDG